MRRTLPLFMLLPTASVFAASSTIVDEIVTTTQRRDVQADVAGNIASLSPRQIADIGHLHIEDALLRLPGVGFHQGSGQEYLPSVRSAVLSGGGACGSFLTAQDNIPLRAAGFCNVNELFEANTEQAERIEVIRGPSNALYGSNAQHGVINVILPAAPDEQEASVSVEAGSNDFRRQKVSFGNKVGDHAFVINVNTTHDGGFRDESYYDQQKLQMRHETTVADWNVATTFAATNLNQETAGYITGHEVYKDRDIAEQNFDTNAYRDAKSFRLYSRWEKQLAENQSIAITPYARKTEMEFLQHFLPGTPLEENGQKSVGSQLTWYLDGGALNWIAGTDFEYTNGYLIETQQDDSFGAFPTGKHYDYEVDALQVAPFVQAEWSVSDALLLTAGLRLEQMRYDYTNNMTSGNLSETGVPCRSGGAIVTCRYSRPADRDDDFTNVSPKLGLVYRISDNHEVFSSLANGFRAPQATEMYRLQENQSIADLESEELESFEVGLRGRGDGFNYEVVAYAMQKDNIIFRDADFKLNLGDGKTRHRGLELSGGYTFLENWEVRGVLNYGNHRYDGNQSLGSEDIDGNYEDSAPRYFGSAHLGWQFLPSAKAELEYVHMGSYYTDPENNHKYEGHDLYNLRARWSFNDSLSLSLRLINATDVEYADRADYSGLGGGDRYFPGAPRSLFAGVTYSF